MNEGWPPPPKGDPPICKNCRYNSMGSANCFHPQNTRFDPVKGRHNDLDAYNMRSRGGCGPKGILFEAKCKHPSLWDHLKAFFTGVKS